MHFIRLHTPLPHHLSFQKKNMTPQPQSVIVYADLARELTDEEITAIVKSTVNIDLSKYLQALEKDFSGKRISEFHAGYTNAECSRSDMPVLSFIADYFDLPKNQDDYKPLINIVTYIINKVCESAIAETKNIEVTVNNIDSMTLSFT